MSVNQWNHSVALCGIEKLQNLYLEKLIDLPNVGTLLFPLFIFTGDSQGRFISQSLKVFLVWKKIAMKFAFINEDNKLRETYENIIVT